MIRGLWQAAVALALALPCAADDLRLGTTHTLEDSGILPVLVDAFTRATGVRVRPLVAGTGQVMKYAQNGDPPRSFHAPRWIPWLTPTISR